MKLVARTAIIVWSLALSACLTGSQRPIQPGPSPVTTPVTLSDPTFPAQCRDIWQQELGRSIDPAGLAACLEQFRGGASGEAIRAGVQTSVEYAERQAKIEEAKKIKPLLPLRVDGVRFVTADGATYRPVFASILSILRRTPAERDAILDELVELGFNGGRVFSGRLTWAGQTAESARAALPGLLEAANRRGLRVLVTAVTDSRDGGYDVPAHLAAVADIVAQHPGNLLECGNEYWHPSQSSDVNDAEWLERTCRAAFARSGLPWALGAPSTDEPTEAGIWPIPSGSFVTAHLDRSRDTWNQVRRVRELRAILDAVRKPVLNSEPMGAAETDQPGRRLSDPSFFFALGALDRLFGIGGVFHSESGLQGLELGPVQRECARAFVAGSNAIPSTDELSYQNVGWAGSPVGAARFVEAGGVVVRAYSFIAPSGEAYVIVLHTSADLPASAVSWRPEWATRAPLPGRPHVSLFRVSRSSLLR